VLKSIAHVFITQSENRDILTKKAHHYCQQKSSTRMNFSSFETEGVRLMLINCLIYALTGSATLPC